MRFPQYLLAIRSKMVVLAMIAASSWLIAADEPATKPVQAKSFKIFDNFAYAGKPETGPLGIINCNIIYNPYQGSKTKEGLPDEEAFKKIVQARAKKPGPIVIDIEGVWLNGPRDYVEPHFKLFVTLVKWAHEAVPGCIVGYYGHGLFPEEPGKEYAKEKKELADAADAFFPSMYTHNDDRPAWSKRGEELVKTAHEIAPGKPVYFYIWPQYHNHAKKKALEFLTGEHWDYELATSQKCGADGVVIWSSNKPAFDADAEWWKTTLKFLKQIPDK